MFDSILERVLSYRRIVYKFSSHWLSVSFNIFKNVNDYIYIFSKKIRYNLELKQDLYYLGKYVSKLDKRKYDLSSDKAFINLMNSIRYKQGMIEKNNRDLSALKDKDKTSKYL